MVNFHLCRSCLCVDHKIWKWLACCKHPDLKKVGLGTPMLAAVGHSLCLYRRWALGCAWEMVESDALARDPHFQPFKVSALGALMGGRALPFGVEGIKVMWLDINLSCVTALTKLCFIKRESHFPDTVALTFSQGHLLPQRWYGCLPGGSNIAFLSHLFYASALNFCETTYLCVLTTSTA